MDANDLKALIVKRANARGNGFNAKAFSERLERSCALNKIDFERLLTAHDVDFAEDVNRIWRDQVPVCLIPEPTREEKLEEALQNMVECYEVIMRSGDYGNWRSENDLEYLAAKALLK